MEITLTDTLAQLESLGNEKVRAQNKKNGAGDNQVGVRHGDIRKLAAKIKTNDHLGFALRNTGNIDARLLAILLIKPQNLSRDKIDGLKRLLDPLLDVVMNLTPGGTAAERGVSRRHNRKFGYHTQLTTVLRSFSATKTQTFTSH